MKYLVAILGLTFTGCASLAPTVDNELDIFDLDRGLMGEIRFEGEKAKEWGEKMNLHVTKFAEKGDEVKCHHRANSCHFRFSYINEDFKIEGLTNAEQVFNMPVKISEKADTCEYVGTIVIKETKTGSLTYEIRDEYEFYMKNHGKDIRGCTPKKNLAQALGQTIAGVNLNSDLLAIRR